jgi:hypothetical protein
VWSVWNFFGIYNCFLGGGLFCFNNLHCDRTCGGPIRGGGRKLVGRIGTCGLKRGVGSQDVAMDHKNQKSTESRVEGA